MFKRTIVVLALFGAGFYPTFASAQGNFNDWGKATAGVIVYGGVACALTRALLNEGLAICTPHQAQYGRPIVQQQAHLLPQQHPMYSTEYRYLGRVYVPAGQQPGGNVQPPPPAPPAPAPKVTQLAPKGYDLATLEGYCRPGRHLWAPATCTDEASCKAAAAQAKCVDDKK